MKDPVQSLSWDDLRIVQAVGKSGALASAAAMLGVNISTIARRLTRMEEKLGAALFDRRRISGYPATREGREIITLAERVELDVVVSVVRRVSGSVQSRVGSLRITTSDSDPAAFPHTDNRRFSGSERRDQDRGYCWKQRPESRARGNRHRHQGNREAAGKSVRAQDRDDRLGTLCKLFL